MKYYRKGQIMKHNLTEYNITENDKTNDKLLQNSQSCNLK